MAVPDTSIDPRILESAKVEFLRLGYEKTSLKEICKKANVTTGALYKRYKGKEELFGALVEPTITELQTLAKAKSFQSVGTVTDAQLIKGWEMDEAYMLWWFQFLYERKEEMVLLLKCSEGSKYSSFRDDWPERITKYSYEFYQEAYRRKLTRVEMNQSQLHILLTAFWTTIFEPLVHAYSWDEIETHSIMVCKLFDWHRVLEFKK